MNEIRQLRKKAGLDMREIALAEKGIGHIRLDTARAICDSLNASLSSLFPDLRDVLDALPDATDDDLRAALMAPKTAEALLAGGLDPDDMRWFAVVKTQSGNEMKYLLSSPEMKYVVGVLHQPQTKFIRFSSDCRQIILKLDAIADFRLTTSTSYAPFSSRESAFEVKVFWSNGDRPERVEVATERSRSGGCEHIMTGRGEDVPAFVSLTMEDGDTRFIATDAIDAIEIPIGVVMPAIYLDATPFQTCSTDDDLSELDPIGTA
jgi:transcriptional regulator with XRE-family HTH domain